MIKAMRDGIWQDCATLSDALEITGRGGPVISVIGAGGKTSVIQKLAEEYLAGKKPAVVTTTTHMMIPRNPYLLLEESIDTLVGRLDNEGQVWLGIPAKDGKMKSVSAEFLRKVLRLKLPVLIEADGARKLPCKAPAAHEPVIIPGTTLVVNVYGLDCLGKTIASCCYRPDTVAAILHTGLRHRLKPVDIARLGMSGCGGRKNLSAAMKYKVILNKADDKERIEMAKAVYSEFEKLNFRDVIILSEGK